MSAPLEIAHIQSRQQRDIAAGISVPLPVAQPQTVASTSYSIRRRFMADTLLPTVTGRC